MPREIRKLSLSVYFFLGLLLPIKTHDHISLAPRQTNVALRRGLESIMAYLQNSKVVRAGITARHWSPGTKSIKVLSGYNGVKIHFKLASKGGGTTEIMTTISPEDFGEVINQMMITDRSEALKVMSLAIAEHHA